MTVNEIMKKDVATCTPNDDMATAVKIMHDHKCGFVPVVGSIRIVVAIFSYDGGLYFGVTGDYDGAPDIDVLTAGIASGMSDLLALAGPAPARPLRPPRGARKPGARKPAAARAGARAEEA